MPLAVGAAGSGMPKRTTVVLLVTAHCDWDHTVVPVFQPTILH